MKYTTKILSVENLNNSKNFLKLIIEPLNHNSIEKMYEENNVVFERVDLYKKFTLKLNKLIQETYMGDEFTDNPNRKKHFNWCWIKVCEEFEVYGIFFLDNPVLYDYFKTFLFKTFYDINDKENSKIPTTVESVFQYLFDYNNNKSLNDIKTFINIYNDFELSYLNKIK